MKAATAASIRKDLTDIIWLQTGFLGDIVLNTGAFAVAKQHFPHIRQHLITTNVGAAALKGHSLLTSIHVFQKGRGGPLRVMRRLAAELRQVVPEKQGVILLQPHRSFRSGFLATVLGYPRIVFSETDFAFKPVARVPRIAILHEAQRDALLLEPLGVSREEILAAQLTLDPLPAENGAWNDFLHGDGPLLLCAPGSVWGTKRWLPERYRALMQKTLTATAARIIFLGGEAERDVVSEVTQSLPSPERWLDLAGRTSLDDLRRIYPHASALVSNDSSAIHYASAFQVPTVAVFGATVAAMGFGPLARGSKVCELKALPCRPCSDHGPQTCPLTHFKCMRDLEVDTVWQALVPLLGAEHPVTSVT